MSTSLLLRTQRWQLDALAFPTPFIDEKTGLGPVHPRGTDLRIEVGLFLGLRGLAPTTDAQVITIGDYSSLTCELKLTGDALANAVAATTSSFATLTASAWNAGTGQHAVFTFTDAEMNVAALNYHVVVSGITAAGKKITFGISKFRIVEDGAGFDADPPPTNPGSAISLAEATALIVSMGGGSGAGVDSTITSLADLSALTTFGSGPDASEGSYRTFDIEGVNGGIVIYKLRAGTEATASPYIIRPDDYASLTTKLVWEKRA